MCLAELGEFAESTAATQAVRVAEAIGHPYSLGLASLHASTPYLRKGEFDAPFPCSNGASAWSHLGLPNDRSLLQITFSGRIDPGLLEVGRLGEALDHALRAHDDLQSGNERGSQAWVLKLLAYVVCRRDSEQHERAETSYQRALTLADELRMRPLIAHCHLGLGLATATAMYCAMGMTYWLEKAEAEVTNLGR